VAQPKYRPQRKAWTSVMLNSLKAMDESRDMTKRERIISASIQRCPCDHSIDLCFARVPLRQTEVFKSGPPFA
ncbi:MAG TPA: hypothetical protein PK760_16475, partial [Flavobacteriales bacterium]|nr:hypothetical protein [Flavobacteriales bacterium]